MKAVIDVVLKNGVLDPQGKAVEHALKSLGYSGISNVRIGKQMVVDIVEYWVEKARKEIV